MTEKRRTADVILTSVFCAFILIIGLLIYILPQKSFSENENSDLQTCPTLNYDSFMHGDFTKELDVFGFASKEDFFSTAIFQKGYRTV